MEIIELRHPYNKDVIPSEPVVLVLGFFDGVHLGHQKVIETGKAAAKEKD
ncbi:Riboflavin kinase / FMNadenylyltransferase [Enterococcus sp. HSIEG1]|nr:Riboflavin kinase / FMNadenylyltransferase [Enterococcus sp. HSIEG1]